MTLDSTAIRLYINGVQDSTGTGVSSIPTGGALGIAADPGNATVWVGLLDEVRISNVSRSANWIKTEYNNQITPATFYSLAAQETY